MNGDINIKKIPKTDHLEKESNDKPKDFKKIFFRIFQTLVMMGVVVVITTLVVDATDNIDNFSNSLIGSAIGISGSDGGGSRCPDGMVYITSASGSFCIDKYTASASDDCPYPEPSSQSQTRENLSANECKPVSVAGAMPWRYISQTQAQEACQQVGKFLPDNEKWFNASRGTPSDRAGSLNDCNLDNNWNDSPGPTGSGENCVSGFNTFDQVGNTWEWVNDIVRDGVIDGHKLPETGYITSVDTKGIVLATDPDEPDENYNKDWLWVNPEGTRGVMRGGFFGSRSDGGVYSFHAEMTPDFSGRAVGFRCVSETNN